MSWLFEICQEFCPTTKLNLAYASFAYAKLTCQRQAREPIDKNNFPRKLSSSPAQTTAASSNNNSQQRAEGSSSNNNSPAAAAAQLMDGNLGKKDNTPQP